MEENIVDTQIQESAVSVDSFVESMAAQSMARSSGLHALEQYHRYLYASRFVRQKRVLDLSCGEGFGTAFLSLNADSVLGIDIRSSCVDEARKKYSQFSNVQFEVCELDAFLTPDPSFDVVVCFGVLETLSEEARHRLVNNVRKVLAPGGLFVASSSMKNNGYSDGNGHTSEFSALQFSEFLKQYFTGAIFVGQKPVAVSTIWSLYQWQNDFFRFYARENLFSLPPEDEQFTIPSSVIAICSDVALSREIAENSKSVYFDTEHACNIEESLSRLTGIEDEVSALRANVRDLREKESQSQTLVDQLLRESSEYRSGFEQTRQQLEEREGLVRTLENDLANAHAANETLQQAYDLRTARANTIKEEAVVLSQQTIELQRELDERLKRIQQLSDESEKLRIALLSLQDEMAERTGRLDHKTEEVERLRLQLTEREQQAGGQAALARKAQEEIVDLKQELSSLQMYAAEKERLALITEERFLRADQTVQEQRERITYLQRAIDEQSEISEQHEVLAERVRGLERLVSEKEEAVLAKEQELDSLRQELDLHRQQSEVFGETDQQHRKEVETLSIELSAAREELAAVRDQVHMQTQTVEEAVARKHHLEERNRELERVQQHHDSSLEKMRQEMETLRHQMAEMHVQIQERSDTIAKHRQELEKQQSLVDEKSRIAESAKKDWEHIRQEVETLRAESTARGEKIERLELQIREQTDFLKNLERESHQHEMNAREARAELERQLIAFDTYQKSQTDLQQRYTRSQIRLQELQASYTMIEQKFNRVVNSGVYVLASTMGLAPKEKI